MSDKKGVIVAGKDARKRSRNEKPADTDKRTETDSSERRTKENASKDRKIIAGNASDDAGQQKDDTLERRNAEQARKAPRDTEFAGHPEFSQDAASNTPPAGAGNGEAGDDVDDKTLHSDGTKPTNPPVSARRSKDA